MPEKFPVSALPVARTVDASGVRCPLPLLRAKQALQAIAVTEVLEVLATDQGAARDIPAWCRLAGHELLAQEQHDEVLHFWIRRQQ